ISPYRFIFVTYLAVAIMLGLIVDHTYAAVHQRGASDRRSRHGPRARSPWQRMPRWVAPAAGIVVALVALAPPASYLGQSLPVATDSIVLPIWFQKIAPRLHGNQVLLVLPAP